MKKRTVTLIAVMALDVFLIWLVACAPKSAPESARQLGAQAPASPAVTISPGVPNELNATGGGAPKATIQQAAAFAWQEFIALNWPAVNQTGAANTRDMPDTNKKFGDQSVPLVWQTFRGKVEIFPGNGSATVGPPGSGIGSPAPSPALPDYGYDAAPQYIYSSSVGPCAAPAPAQSSVTSPAWVNADEISQIGLDHMYAGILPGPSANSSPTPVNSQPQLIRFLAKANRTQYKYVVGSQFWYQNNDGTDPADTAAQSFINTTSSQPSPQPPQSPFVNFPPGTIEVKAAFRELAANEDPTRFHVTTVRYYEEVGTSGNGCYREAPMALIALHIIQKTPSAPSFIYATFEQADNILLPQNDANGKPVPVENADGKVVNQPSPSTPTSPDLSYKDGPTQSNPNPPLVSLNPANAPPCTPGNQIFYQNIAPSSSPSPPPSPGEPVGGKICINYRDHTIPQTIIDVNHAAHDAIAQYNSMNGIKNSPWQYYKLVNVQAYPFNKPADDSDPNHGLSTFFQSNSVVETNYTLQNFSGRLAANFAVTQIPPATPSPLPSPPNPVVPPNDYVYSGSPPPSGVTSYNMGGCMGCHANAQSNGFDFSFILSGGQDTAPDFPTTPTLTLMRKYNFAVERLRDKKKK